MASGLLETVVPTPAIPSKMDHRYSLPAYHGAAWAGCGLVGSATQALSSNILPLDNPIALLHAPLSQRDTPEAVEELIERALAPRLARHTQALLPARLAASVERRFDRSSMPMTFEAPVHVDRILAKARELAPCS